MEEEAEGVGKPITKLLQESGVVADQAVAVVLDVAGVAGECGMGEGGVVAEAVGGALAVLASDERLV